MYFDVLSYFFFFFTILRQVLQTETIAATAPTDTIGRKPPTLRKMPERE